MSSTMYSRCGRCGEEIVDRRDVKSVVDGVKRVWIGRKSMGWCLEMSKAGYVYRKRQLGEQITMFDGTVHCGCDKGRMAGVSASHLAIRAEYREIVAKKFGEQLTVPFLFALPTDVVAWENCGFLGAEPSDRGPVVSRVGRPMLDVINEMSRMGFFEGSMATISVDELTNEYGHLHLVKPEFRIRVALAFGKSVKLATLLAEVNLDWLDWQAMAWLRCVSENGKVTISRTIGVPVVDAMCNVFAGRPVSGTIAGSRVGDTNTCIQFMKNVSGHVVEERTAVELLNGEGFFPCGPLVLRGDKRVVTFEPGFTLCTDTGIRVCAKHAAVSVFVDGLAAFTIVKDGMLDDDPGLGDMKVAVVVEEYGEGTALGDWHNKRLGENPDDVQTLFLNEVEFMLLHTATPLVGKDLLVENWHGAKNGRAAWSCALGAVKKREGVFAGCVRSGPGIVTVAAGGFETASECHWEFGGALRFPERLKSKYYGDDLIVAPTTMWPGDYPRVGFIEGLYVEYDGPKGEEPVGLDFVQIGDREALDDGGLSDDFQYELSLGVHNATTHHVFDVLGALVDGFDVVDTFIGNVALDPLGMLHDLGRSPTIQEILEQPYDRFNIDALWAMRIGLNLMGRFAVAGGLVADTYGWKEVCEAMVHHRLKEYVPDGRTLYNFLCTAYNVKRDVIRPDAVFGVDC